MSPIPLGILAPQGGFSYNPVLAYDLLLTVPGTSFFGSTLQFNNLSAYSANYKHLELRATIKSDGQSTTWTPIRIAINGIGLHYTQTMSINGGGTGAFVSEASRIQAGEAPQSTSAVANTVGNITAKFVDAFNGNKVKTVFFQTNAQGSSQSRHSYGVGMKASETSAINSITISIESGNFVDSLSSFSLYGIRG